MSKKREKAADTTCVRNFFTTIFRFFRCMMVSEQTREGVSTVTPFEGSKCLLLLHLGWKEDYFRLLDQAMEQEDPLSTLTLDLALCGSDTEAAAIVLTFDPEVRAIPQEMPLGWLKEKLYQEYRLNTLTPERLSRLWQSLSTSYDLIEDKFWCRVDYLLEYRELKFITEKKFWDSLHQLFELDKNCKDGENPCF